MICLLLGLSLVLGGATDESVRERHVALIAQHERAALLDAVYDLEVVRLADDGTGTVVNEARGAFRLARPAAGKGLVEVRRDGARLTALELFGDGRHWYTIDRARRKYTRTEANLEGEKWTPQLELFRVWTGASAATPISVSGEQISETDYTIELQYHDFEETYRFADDRLVTASRAFQIVNAQGISRARYDYRFERWRLAEDGDTVSLATDPPAGHEEIDSNWKRTKLLVPPGRPLPDLRLVFLDGRVAQLSELRGKTVVLSFWFVDCAPCRKELPELSDLAEKYADRDDVVFVCVNGIDQRPVIEKFWLAKKLVPQAAMALGSDIQKCRVSAYPSLYVVGRTGLVELRATGFDPQTSMHKLERAIEASLP